MGEEKAKAILGDLINPDGTLYGLGRYIFWTPKKEDPRACLDGHFSADELEAIAWWMRHKTE